MHEVIEFPELDENLIYPEWFQRIAAVHDFKGQFNLKACSKCQAYHSEVAVLLIEVAGWECHPAESYNTSVLKAALNNPGSMSRYSIRPSGS